jgi:hypothetical protein
MLEHYLATANNNDAAGSMPASPESYRIAASPRNGAI